MASFYESLKDLFSPQMATKTARVLEEKESDINKAASQIIAGLMGVMARKGNSSQISNIFEEAGNINLIADEGMFDEHLTHPQQTMGDNFLQQLLGDKAADFTEPISKDAGISEVAVNRLVSMIGPSFPAFFGKKMREGMSYQGIIDQIKAQERTFASKIPAGVVKAFGLGSVLDTTKSYATNKSTPNYATSGISNSNPEPKKKNSWITWLLVILAILLIIFWWRSCNKRGDNMAMNTSNVEYRADTTDVMSRANPRVSDSPAEVDEVMAITEIDLPNGETLSANRNGVEEQMVNYLNSDEYKDASAEDLKGKWFEFDNIAFEFGSTTELKDQSRAQLNNIASILRAHKDVKVMVAAFADKRGTETANMKVSKERAKTIERMLDQAGVGSQVVKTEGLGDEYAEYSADAPDRDRMKDRDIALRFVK